MGPAAATDCDLTLELSGGAAVRLECSVVRLATNLERVMNTTIAIVLPAWIAWMTVGVIALAGINEVAALHIKWLQRKLALLRDRENDHAA